MVQSGLDEDEALDLIAEIDLPLVVTGYGPGEHPAELLMARVKASVR